MSDVQEAIIESLRAEISELMMWERQLALLKLERLGDGQVPERVSDAYLAALARAKEVLGE